MSKDIFLGLYKFKGFSMEFLKSELNVKPTSDLHKLVARDLCMEDPIDASLLIDQYSEDEFTKATERYNSTVTPNIKTETKNGK